MKVSEVSEVSQEDREKAASLSAVEIRAYFIASVNETEKFIARYQIRGERNAKIQKRN